MATRNEQETIRQLLESQAEFQQQTLKTIELIVEKFTTSHGETSKVLQSWLDSFKVTALPTSTVVHDTDIVAREREYYRGQGYEVAEHDLPNSVEEGITAMMKGI
jgi:hypothetical protein